MKLKELREILSNYNFISLRIYDTDSVVKEAKMADLRHLETTYDNYHVIKIETLKTNVLTIRLKEEI